MYKITKKLKTNFITIYLLKSKSNRKEFEDMVTSIFISILSCIIYLLFTSTIYCNDITLITKTISSGKPEIALFIQIGHMNATTWSYLSSCIENVAKAKILSTQTSIFYNLQKNINVIVDNFNVDLYISFNSLVDLKHRLRVLSELEMHKFDNIYTSVVKNVGLDYKPFLEQMSIASSHKNYDLVLKLHSKSHRLWLSHSVQCLCGTPSHVLAIVNEFKMKNNVHMIVPHGLTFGINTPLDRIYPLLIEKYYTHTPLSAAFDPGMVTQMENFYQSVFDDPLNVDPQNLRIVAGSIFWTRFKALYPLKFSTVLKTMAHQFTNRYIDNHGIEHVIERVIPTMILKHGGSITEMIPAPKIMPIYFPQYHAFPENDRFWGKDFTEWTLLKPLHTAPNDIHKPLAVSDGGLGYYNLTDIDIRKQQTVLAKQAGMHGFVYYHYWFSGKYAPKDHKVMYKITELRLKDGQPDLPFMLSWANEPWSRRWSGNDEDILLSQDYGDAQEWEEHFYYLLQFFKHRQYIKLDGRPVFIIYRIGHGNLVRVLQPMLKLWNQLAIQNGFLKGLYIISTIGNFYEGDRDTIRMTGNIKEISATFHFFPFVHSVYKKFEDWASLKDIAMVPSDTQYWGTYTGFCNRPRNPSNYGNHKVSPEQLNYWLKKSFAAMNMKKWKTIEQNFYFVMAWNEWNEQAVMEPNDRFKFEYLEVFQQVLQTLASIPAP